MDTRQENAEKQPIDNRLSLLKVTIELQLVEKGVIIVLPLALERYLQFET